MKYKKHLQRCYPELSSWKLQSPFYLLNYMYPAMLQN